MTYKFKRNGHICNTIEPIPVDWDKRPIIKQYNDKNELIVRSYGETDEELLQAHLERRCGAFCGYCYHEAMVVIGEEAPAEWLVEHWSSMPPKYAQINDGIYPDPDAEEFVF